MWRIKDRKADCLVSHIIFLAKPPMSFQPISDQYSTSGTYCPINSNFSKMLKLTVLKAYILGMKYQYQVTSYNVKKDIVLLMLMIYI